jgi:hypothetical protein
VVGELVSLRCLDCVMLPTWSSVAQVQRHGGAGDQSRLYLERRVRYSGPKLCTGVHVSGQGLDISGALLAEAQRTFPLSSAP